MKAMILVPAILCLAPAAGQDQGKTDDLTKAVLFYAHAQTPPLIKTLRQREEASTGT
jgi:hypothetical protein